MKYKIAIQIPVINLKKGIDFYETIFGWKCEMGKFSEGVGEFKLDAKGVGNELISITIFETNKTRPKGLNVGFGVQNLDEGIKKIKEKGGIIVKDKFEFIPGEFVAVFQDCCGNELSLFELK